MKDIVMDMDTDGVVCLIDLQQIAYGNQLEQGSEKDLRSLFQSALTKGKMGWPEPNSACKQMILLIWGTTNLHGLERALIYQVINYMVFSSQREKIAKVNT